MPRSMKRKLPSASAVTVWLVVRLRTSLFSNSEGKQHSIGV